MWRRLLTYPAGGFRVVLTIKPLDGTRGYLGGLVRFGVAFATALTLVSSVYAQTPAAPTPAPPAPAKPQRVDIEPDLNRWRLLEPQGIGEKPRSPLYDPYTPNVTKGDIPIFGDKVFFSATGVLDSFFEVKRNLDFFSAGRFRNVPYHETNLLGQLTAVLFLEVFQGDTVFAPKDWAVRVAPVIRFRCGDKNAIDQGCGEYITLQEAFGELKLFE